MKTCVCAAVLSVTTLATGLSGVGGAGTVSFGRSAFFQPEVSPSIFFAISAASKSPTTATVVTFGANVAAWNALRSAAVSFSTTGRLPYGDRPNG